MADQKLTDLAATAAPASGDLFYIVTTPGGTPASKKVTIDDSFNYFLKNTGLGIGADTGTGRAYVRVNNGGNVAPFAMGTGGSTFVGVFDSTFFWGYNAAQGGSVSLANEPNFLLSMEADYYVRAIHTFEYNWGVTTKNNALSWRPYEFSCWRDATTNADNEASHTFYIGNNSYSYFRVNNPATASPLFNIAYSGQLELHTTTAEFLRITPSVVTGNAKILFDIASAGSAPYFVFSNPVGIGYDPPDTTYGLTVTSIKVNSDNPGIRMADGGKLTSTGTGSSGWVISNPRNYAGTTLSGGNKIIELDIGGTPYYLLARGGYS